VFNVGKSQKSGKLQYYIFCMNVLNIGILSDFMARQIALSDDVVTRLHRKPSPFMNSSTRLQLTPRNFDCSHSADSSYSFTMILYAMSLCPPHGARDPQSGVMLKERHILW